MRLTLAGGFVACLTAGVFAQPSWTPARLVDGAPPAIPVEAVSGGEVFVEATVTRTGAVSDVAALRITPPFTQSVLDAVRDWRFQTADQSQVLIACVFRPPTLNGVTLGEPPRDVTAASEDVAVPVKTVIPLYPPMALADGAVIVHVTVGVDGRVANATAVRSAAAFDESAVAAARQWLFRPARIDGRLEQTAAFLVFAFRQPVAAPVALPSS
jgi:TonB family protein